jgi:predicted nuclease with RNAse H fold
MRSLGIDVGVNKGCHFVLMDGRFQVVEKGKFARPSEVAYICSANGPDVVCVDSPPYWGHTGNSRKAERELRKKGIQTFATPSVSDRQKQQNPFYGWMKVGFAIFDNLAPTTPRYREGNPNQTAIEVFPHASAVFLAGSHRPNNLSKVCWRREILRSLGVSIKMLTNADLVDAALAAITGIRALKGDYSSFGDPDEGVIVVPVRNAATMKLK